jgi:HK97 family phage prohead protease
MNRAYSVLTVKAVDDDQRIITGVATTPEPDRMGDVVEPLGVKFKNPMPLLHQHDSHAPVGTVKFDKPTKDGITFTAQLPTKVDSPDLQARIDMAWAEVKAGLVRAVSIGFRALEYAFIEGTGGIRFIESEVLELSLVSIPANAGATITAIKSIDTTIRAATGIKDGEGRPVPPAPGKTLKITTLSPTKGQTTMTMKNVGAQIAALEATRKEKAEAMESIQVKCSTEGRTKDADERKQFDELRAELKTLDAEIADLKDIEAIHAPTAQPVDKNADPAPQPRQRMTPMVKKPEEKGLAFARYVKVKAVSRLDIVPELQVAEKMYGRDSELYHTIKTGEQIPGSTTSGNWGADLISAEGGIAADFAEYLRPATILGKFGQNGIPALRRVPFRRALIQQTAGAGGYWVGEGKPKPVEQLNFDRSTLDPLKCATIVVLTEENIRDSSPSSDMIVRDDLRAALAALEDVTFITPTNAGTGGSKPAGILYDAGGANAIAAESYTDESDVVLDIRSLAQRYINANNPAGQAVLVMEEGTALACSLILNALGQRAFPDLGARGGNLLGYPVITSEHVPAGIVVMLNASDVLLGDDGGITVDMSREASLEMKNQANITQNGLTGAGASLVSLWQNNLVGIRAEHTINWKPRRPVIGAYLTGVAWGGAVNAS